MEEPRPEGADLPPLDGAPGPAPLISRRREDALLEAVLARHYGRRARASVPRLFRVAAAVLITLVAVAAAAAVTYLVVREPPASPPRPERPPRRQPAVSPARADTALPPDAGAPDAEPAATPTTRPARSDTGRSAPARGSARDLLDLANRRRSARRWRRAERLYRRVIQRHPRSDQAYAARVAAATLRLEQLGDPAGALRLYRSALAERRRRALRQEILYGIAECQRALGRRQAELRALRAYIEAFPDGAMNGRARRRLRALQR
jgi:tetratricopeptide (TPR) repeat protein